MAVASLTASCSPCGGPCDDTVHHFPIKSANYTRLHGGPFGCLDYDAGQGADAGEPDPDLVCDELVSIDAVTGKVTHSFTYRGKSHVVLYRTTSVETIEKSQIDYLDNP